MNIFEEFQIWSQSFSLTSEHDNYYPLLILVISTTFILIVIFRIITRFLLRRFIPKDYDKLNNKVIRKTQNLVTGTILFTGIVTVLVVFFYSDTVLWKNMLQVLFTIFFVYTTFALMAISKAFLSMLSRKGNVKFITKQTIPLFYNIANILVIIIVLYIVLVFVWNININALFASMGIIGVAVSFAARDTIANFFSGVFIMADQPYKIGDFVKLDSGQRGEVVDIGIRSTRILTMDNVEIVIPNSIMGNTPVINESGGLSRDTRINVEVTVSYESDPSIVKKILVYVAQHSRLVLKNPEPTARFIEFGESGLKFQLLCWIEEASQKGKVTDELNVNIYNALKSNNIEIPYKKHDVYIKEFKQQ